MFEVTELYDKYLGRMFKSDPNVSVPALKWWKYFCI
jgi:hypothetical protein